MSGIARARYSGPSGRASPMPTRCSRTPKHIASHFYSIVELEHGSCARNKCILPCSGVRYTPYMHIAVGVLRGGPSREHEVSLKSGAAMLAALSPEKYCVRDIY